MKKVPISFQKMIMWIPGINVLNVPIWFYNSFFWDKHTKTIYKTMYIIMSTSLPVVVFDVLIRNFGINVLDGIRSILISYFFPFILGLRLVRYQEQLEQKMK